MGEQVRLSAPGQVTPAALIGVKFIFAFECSFPATVLVYDRNLGLRSDLAKS